MDAPSYKPISRHPKLRTFANLFGCDTAEKNPAGMNRRSPLLCQDDAKLSRGGL
jgi:hypothetical protein